MERDSLGYPAIIKWRTGEWKTTYAVWRTLERVLIVTHHAGLKRGHVRADGATR